MMRYNQDWVDKTWELYNKTCMELQEMDERLKPLLLRAEKLRRDIKSLENKLKCDRCGISIAGTYQYKGKTQLRIEQKLHIIGDKKVCSQCLK